MIIDVSAVGGFVALSKPGASPHLAMKPEKARLVAHECGVCTHLALALGCQPDHRLDQTVTYAENLLAAADVAEAQVVDLSLARMLGIFK